LMAMKPVKAMTMAKDMPTRGVYLFSKKGKPLYVGRSNKLHRRPGRHCGVTATHRMAALRRTGRSCLSTPAGSAWKASCRSGRIRVTVRGVRRIGSSRRIRTRPQ
jgi:hypothetical protein